ncbi:MAG: hypothetical protein NZ653_01320 [Anaerolineae bacterium]|nr:hypothetical protein [Anaerolineae bacterium]
MLHPSRGQIPLAEFFTARQESERCLNPEGPEQLCPVNATWAISASQEMEPVRPLQVVLLLSAWVIFSISKASFSC